MHILSFDLNLQHLVDFKRSSGGDDYFTSPMQKIEGLVFAEGVNRTPVS